jgi:hypothetical protein
VAAAGMPAVSVNGTPVTVGVHGVDTNYEWTFRGIDNSVVQLADAPPGTPNSPLTGADTLDVTYGGNYPYGATAEDAGEIAANEIWERVFEEPNVLDRDVADAMAAAYLERAITTYQAVTYETLQTGIHPGQTQTITCTERNLSGTFMVTDVETYDIGSKTPMVKRRVRAIGGTTILGSWRDVARAWGGRRTGSTSSVVINSSTTGTSTAGIYVDLGGSRNISPARSAGYVPVVDYRLYTATASYGGRVRAQTWAKTSGVSSTVRLYNVTDSSVVATSSVVTSTTASDVTFLASITSGKTYRLDVLSSDGSEGVFAIGSLEAA